MSSTNLSPEVDLSEFGLSDSESTIYLSLLKNGPFSTLELSKNLQLPRTNIYRICERLQNVGLVTTRDTPRGQKYEVSPLGVFDELLEKQQQELNRKRKLLPDLMGSLVNVAGRSTLGSRVHYYSGIDGIMQVNRNTLNADKILRGIEIKTMSEVVGHDEAEQMRDEYAKRGIRYRQLTNCSYFSPYTDSKFAKMTEIRYLDPVILKIEFEVLIYNDVYVMYTYVEKRYFLRRDLQSWSR